MHQPHSPLAEERLCESTDSMQDSASRRHKVWLPSSDSEGILHTVALHASRLHLLNTQQLFLQAKVVASLYHCLKL